LISSDYSFLLLGSSISCLALVTPNLVYNMRTQLAQLALLAYSCLKGHQWRQSYWSGLE
jgi:hypothetical protein